MLKSYELLYILHPDLEGTTDKAMDKVAAFITQTNGKILSQEDWGKRKLAYSVAKNDFGVYVLVQFQTETGKLKDIERNLHLSEEIMRYLLVALTEIKEAKKISKREKPVSLIEPAESEKTEKEMEIKSTDKIVLPEEKPKKETVKSEKTTTVKKSAKKTQTEKANKTEEKERLKKLDEKLEELLK